MFLTLHVVIAARMLEPRPLDVGCNVLNIRPNENIYNINRLTKRPSSSCHDDVAFAS